MSSQAVCDARLDGGSTIDQGTSSQDRVNLARRPRAFSANSASGLQRCQPLASLVGMGCFALALGALVYLTDRDPSHAALIPTVAALAGIHMFGGLGQWLPSFVHPFAFSLFTAAAQPSSTSHSYRACSVWWAVNVIFEVAQHPELSPAVAQGVQSVLGQTWLARLLSNYFLRGTFDVGDIVAATAGALAAAGVLYLVHRLETRNAH